MLNFQNNFDNFTNMNSIDYHSMKFVILIRHDQLTRIEFLPFYLFNEYEISMYTFNEKGLSEITIFLKLHHHVLVT